jgi:hypothetical protein
VAKLTAPTLDNAADAEDVAGDEVTLTITPGETGAVTKVYYRVRGASSWTAGPTMTGTAALQATKAVDSLTPRVIYEFIVWSDDGTDLSTPSVVRYATPTDGSGSIEDRIMQAVELALRGITTGNGYYATVNKVCPHSYVPDQLTSGITLFITEVSDTSDSNALSGNTRLTEQSKILMVEGLSELAGRSTTERDKEGRRMFDAISKALLADERFGGLAWYTLHESHEYVLPDERGGAVGVRARYRIVYRHQFDNPGVTGG